MTSEVGHLAPDFSLTSHENQQVRLRQFKGKKHLVLSFHVFDFTRT